MKKYAFLLAFMIALCSIPLVPPLQAHPYTITCPIDGGDMYFDHWVGYGKQTVCWYQHEGTNPEYGYQEHHRAYIPCPDEQ
jgi:hypothetical protein